MPWWVWVTPFFLSALFFLSAFFAVFAPLPLLVFYFRSGRRWAALAALTNAAIVGFLGGGISLTLYAIFIVVLAVSMAELLQRKFSVEKAVGFSLLTVAAAAAACVGAYARIHHVNPVVELHQHVSNWINLVTQSISKDNHSALLNIGDINEWKQSLMLEFPSAIAVFALILAWVNLVLLFRANPKGVRERLGLDPSFLKSWKASEYLVWPTLAAGFTLLVNLGKVSDIGLNVFKFMMAIYALQGLSILSFYFDAWKLRPFLRMAGYVIVVFLLTPLLLSLGFFDLWFDFRRKFRQS